MSSRVILAFCNLKDWNAMVEDCPWAHRQSDNDFLKMFSYADYI